MKPIAHFGLVRGRVTVQRMGAPPDDMRPYDEATSLSVRVRDAEGKPGWHILEMPVNSREAQQRGDKIFGYPKRLEEVEVTGKEGIMVGSAATPTGQPKFMAIVEPILKIPWKLRLTNHNVQTLRDRPVVLDSTARGKLRVGLGTVFFSEEMRARYPGLPGRPFTYLGATLTDAELSLSLPQPSL